MEKAKRALTAASAKADMMVSDALVDKVLADKITEDANRVAQEGRLKKNSERTHVMDFMAAYSSMISTYQMTWQGFMEGVTSSGVGHHVAKLILVDPPYELGFVTKSQHQQLGKLFDTCAAPEATAVIFCSWQQLAGWRRVFSECTDSGDWIVETVFTVHRHTLHGYRSAVTGHKSMTEHCMIVHRKDKLSADQRMRQGKKKLSRTRLVDLEAVLGPPPHGSWKSDFMTDQLPVPSKWYFITFWVKYTL